MRKWEWLKSWEMLMFVILVIVIISNLRLSPYYLGINNLANVFHLSVEKIIVALMMTFIIINGEIDLSVASVMGLSGSLFAWLIREGVSAELAILASLGVGLLCGTLNGVCVTFLGLPSLVVTLAGLIGYRGTARILLQNSSVGGFPSWFRSFAQDGLIGPFPAPVILFFILFFVALAVLNFSAFGRYVYVIGNNKDAARFAGVNVRRVKMTLFVASGFVAAFAGLLYAGRLGAVRADAAEGFELDIITMVLLGGVSIFGGRGTMLGVGLSILVVLNLRNGMGLASLSGNFQTLVVGLILILSVLVPNLGQDARRIWSRSLWRSEAVELEKKGDASIGSI